MQIEDIVLQHDQRGISHFRQYLPESSYQKAAVDLLKNQGTILVSTGLAVNGLPETDGPPGAIFLAKALKILGNSVVIVTDQIAEDLFVPQYSTEFELEIFPFLNEDESKKHAASLIEKYDPSALVSIERCGAAKNGKYLNMRGEDISAITARIDLLFSNDVFSIGIGDGGNEIGMGNLHSEISHSDLLVADPTVVTTDHLLIASVSNWGAYGLVAALARQTGKDLLPSSGEIEKLLEGLVAQGAIDGVTKQQQLSVDGFDLSVTKTILDQLNEWLNGTSLAP